MHTSIRHWLLGTSAALLLASSLSGCGKHDTASPAPATTASSQATVPPPAGDSTPKPADSNTRQAQESNEKTGASGPQTTVGTAASGAPPYTLNGAPEGNASPKSGEPAKK